MASYQYGSRTDPLPIMDLSEKLNPFCTIKFRDEEYIFSVAFAGAADYWDLYITLNGTVVAYAQARPRVCETEEQWHQEVARVIGILQEGLDRNINVEELEDPDFKPGDRVTELQTSHDDLVNRLILAVQDGLKLMVLDQEPED